MLATLTDRHFSDPGWILERKLDGERCLAFRLGNAVPDRARRTGVAVFYYFGTGSSATLDSWGLRGDKRPRDVVRERPDWRLSGSAGSIDLRGGAVR